MQMTSEQLLSDYLNTLGIYETAPLTIQRKRYSASNMIKWANSKGKHVLDIAKPDIENWLKEEKSELKVNSKVEVLISLKTFYDFLIERKYITENPVKEISERMNRANKKKIMRPILFVPDITKMVKTASNPKDRAIILTLYKTYMRAHELLQLNLDNIYWSERRIFIPERKGGSQGNVHFDEECEKALKLWISVRVSNGDDAQFTNLNGNRLEQGYVNKKVKKIGIISGVGKDTNDSSQAVTPHVLRYAFTTHLAQNKCHPK